jgi:NADH-ubiquinone oxidoreductase chain 5
MTGFYSKDFIIESSFGQYTLSSFVVYIIASISAIFTTLYSVKVLYLTFLSNPQGSLLNYKQAHEGNLYMTIPLIILAIFSIFFGYITKDMFIGAGSGFFSDNSIFIHPSHEIFLDTEFGVPTMFKLLPFIFTVFFFIIALIKFEFKLELGKSIGFSKSIYHSIYGFINQRFLVESIYNIYISGKVFTMGGEISRVIDRGAVELIGPFGLEKTLLNLGTRLSKLDTGVITSYALYIFIGLIFNLIVPYICLFDNSLVLLIIIALFSNYNNKRGQQNYNIFKSLPIQSGEIRLSVLFIVLFLSDFSNNIEILSYVVFFKKFNKNRINIGKLIVSSMLILTVGFFLRSFIEWIFDIKVFINYLSVGSIAYYLIMGIVTLKLKNKLTLGNYIALIVIGGIIRIIFPYLPLNQIIEIIKTIPEFLEILISNFFDSNKQPAYGSIGAGNDAGISNPLAYFMQSDSAGSSGSGDGGEKGRKRNLSLAEESQPKRSNTDLVNSATGSSTSTESVASSSHPTTTESVGVDETQAQSSSTPTQAPSSSTPTLVGPRDEGVSAGEAALLEWELATGGEIDEASYQADLDRMRRAIDEYEARKLAIQMRGIGLDGRANGSNATNMDPEANQDLRHIKQRRRPKD